MSYVSLTNPYGNQIIDIAKQVRTQYPTDWANAHNHQPSGNVYIRRVAWAVQLALPQLGVGLNGKRGNPQDMSQDILAFRNDTGCTNACAPGWLELRDIITNAGSPQADLFYGDVTQATIDKNEKGCWIAPSEVEGAQPAPVPEPVQPYPSESPDGGWWGQVFDVEVAKRYAAAKPPRVYPDPADPRSLRWASRVAYDIRDGMTKEESLSKHLQELEAELHL